MIKQKKALFEEANQEIETRIKNDKQNAKEFIRNKIVCVSAYLAYLKKYFYLIKLKH